MKAVSRFTERLTFEDFLNDELVQAAVERKIETIGEALRQLEINYPGSSTALPDARLAVGMRNCLAHGYLRQICRNFGSQQSRISVR